MLLSKCSEIEQIMCLLWCNLFPSEGVDNASITWKELCGFNVGHNCRHIFVFLYNLGSVVNMSASGKWTGAVFISGKSWLRRFFCA